MNFLSELRALGRQRIVQMLGLCGVLVTVTKLCVDLKYSVRDPDTWWHIRTGDWIIDHLAVPHTGLFSRVAENKPWVAYSWIFEVLLSRSFHWFGLIGIGVFGVVLTLLMAYATYWSVVRLSGRFWFSLVLASCSLFAFLFVIMPRPVFLSILYYIVLLTFIFEANRTGNIKQLYWLPLVFVLWANSHIQFIYGMFVLGLFIAMEVAAGLVSRFNIDWIRKPNLPLKQLLLVFAACFAATLIGPYGYRLYIVVVEYSKAKVTYDMIVELQASNFRYLSNFMMLLVGAAGFLAIGWRKQIDLFKLALLTFAALVAYRTVRDCWFLALTATIIIADSMAEPQERRISNSWPERAIIVVVIAAFLALLGREHSFNTRGLDREVSAEFPVDAANFLRRNPLPGPIYNDLDWGGFLIWYLPQYPVAIDGRNDLYGDELDLRFFNAAAGMDYANVPELDAAGCVLLSKRYPLSGLLRADSRFRMVYEDRLAVVYARNRN